MLNSNKNIFAIMLLVFGLAAFSASGKQNIMAKTQLQDKIKGGWAGQTIGVVYGAPVEFKYQSYYPIPL